MMNVFTKLARIPRKKNARHKAAAVPAHYLHAMDRLAQVAQALSRTNSLDGVTAIVRSAARDLTGADGASFVLREGDHCYYADEDAISPLWKGQRFPLHECVSGWVMTRSEPIIIQDIYYDSRVPVDAYRPTFVKSMAMVPIGCEAPIGAIGNYWATHHLPTPEEMKALQALADITSIALENVRLHNERKMPAFEKITH